ncbi:hypothetical protein MG5_01792 [Candida albicans P57072]|nr:hypothetical protein MG5_01792 [Candida albicans P57072]
MSSSPGNSNSEFETLSDVLQTSSPSNQSSRQLQSTGGGTAALNLAEAKIVTHEDKLIQLQSLKIQLSEQRDQLIKSRTSSTNELNDLRLRHHQLTQELSKTRKETNIKNLLDANTSQYIKNLEVKNLKNDDYILNNLNVLPSTDWDLRLTYIKRFVPYLEIDKIRTFNECDSEGSMIRIIEFQLILPLIFQTSFRLLVDCENDSLKGIEIDDLFKISMISNSFYQMVIKNYIPNKKISTLMFGLNSFSKLLHKRMSTINKLVKSFQDNLYDAGKYQDLLDTSDNKKLFAILQTLDQIELIFTKNERQFKIVFNWEIVIGDPLTGICNSRIQLYIIDILDNTTKNLSQVFENLLLQYDISTSLTTIIKTVF